MKQKDSCHVAQYGQVWLLTMRGILQSLHNSILEESHVKHGRQNINCSHVSQSVDGLPLQHVREVSFRLQV